MRSVPARRVVPGPDWTREMLRDVLPIVLLTRLLFVALTLLIPLWRSVFGVGRLALASDQATGTAFDLWNRWDTLWYEDLARLGYNLRGPHNYKNVAFFPLYPLLTRTLHDAWAILYRDVLGVALPDAAYPPYLVPALIVANVCAVGAMAYYYGLVRLDHGRAAARRAVWLLALFPLSFFLFAAYSEGTFLLCAIAFFYALRLHRWWQAGLWGLLAAVSRPPGAVLLLPFVMAWAEAHPVAAGALRARARLAARSLLARARLAIDRLAVSRLAGASAGQAVTPAAVPMPLDLHVVGLGRTPRRRAGDMGAARAGHLGVARGVMRRAGLKRPRDWPAEARYAFSNILPAVAIPLGLLLYMAFLFRQFGDPFWFSRAQHAWWRTFAPPWETLYLSVAWPVGALIRGHLGVWDPAALHDLGYEAAGLAVTWLAWRRLPRVQAVYILLVWLVLLSSPAMLAERQTGEPHHDVLMSLPRMLLMLFPLFTFLGLNRRAFPWLAGLFAAGLVFYTGMFLTGGWIS